MRTRLGPFGVLLWLLAGLGPARADFVIYDFSGYDGSPANPVSGIFTYDTASVPVPPLVVEVFYLDPSRLGKFSLFAITGGLTQPNIGGGPITALAAPPPATTVPEPGGLTLAAVAGFSLAAARRDRRPRHGAKG
jgi:hypothetical protein